MEGYPPDTKERRNAYDLNAFPTVPIDVKTLRKMSDRSASLLCYGNVRLSEVTEHKFEQHFAQVSFPPDK